MMRKLAHMQYMHGNIYDAEYLYREILGQLEKIKVEIPPDAFALKVTHGLAVCLHVQGHWSAAEQLYRHCIEQCRKRLDDISIEHLRGLGDVSKVLLLRRQYTTAENISREVVARLTATAGATHAGTLIQTSTLVNILHDQGRDSEAKELNWGC